MENIRGMDDSSGEFVFLVVKSIACFFRVVVLWVIIVLISSVVLSLETDGIQLVFSYIDFSGEHLVLSHMSEEYVQPLSDSLNDSVLLVYFTSLIIAITSTVLGWLYMKFIGFAGGPLLRRKPFNRFHEGQSVVEVCLCIQLLVGFFFGASFYP